MDGCLVQGMEVLDVEVLLPHTVITVGLIQEVWLVQQTGQQLVQ